MSAGLDEAVRAVSMFLVAEAALGTTLERLAAITRDSIADAHGVGVTMLKDPKQPITAVWTDALSPIIDQAQYDDDTGPCLDAFRTGQVIRVEDTRDVAHVWPSFSRTAVREGVLSTLSIPASAGGETFGVFNLYSRTVAGFGREHQEAIMLLATQAAVVLANACAYWHVFDLAAGLQVAMTSRAAIEQAKGILMATTGRSADQAFELLRQQSQSENRKLRDIAEEIVARQVRA